MANYNQISRGTSDSKSTMELQKLLNSKGNYNLVVDGKFGPATESALKAYQKANNLDVDGIAGPQTWGALTKAQNTTTTTPTATAPAQTENKAHSFTYEAYKPSDAVAQAEELLQQQLAQKPGAYSSAWQTQLDDTLNKILNREKFSYDLNGDALYQQYKDQYTTQGKLAMMDTMGQAQAATGGYGNSYAQSVGQQAYQGYLQQLNEKVPELYQLALDQYNQEGQDLYNLYGLYADRDAQDYGRYRDSVSDYNAELARLAEDAIYKDSTEYGRWLDKTNLDYGIYRDNVADDQWGQSFGLNTAKSGLVSGGDGGYYTANPGWDTATVKAFQKAHGLEVDGKWGPKTAAAYDKDPDWSEKPNYDDVVSTLNQMVKGGGDPNSKDAMGTLGEDIKLVLKDALNDGAITQAEYHRLWSLYGPIQNAYN